MCIILLELVDSIITIINRSLSLCQNANVAYRKKESKILLVYLGRIMYLTGVCHFSGYFSPKVAIKFSYSSLLILSSNSFSSIFSFLWSPKRSCGDATANNIISPPTCQASCRNSDCQFSVVCLMNSFQKTHFELLSMFILLTCKLVVCRYPMHKP